MRATDVLQATSYPATSLVTNVTHPRVRVCYVLQRAIGEDYFFFATFLVAFLTVFFAAFFTVFFAAFFTVFFAAFFFAGMVVYVMCEVINDVDRKFS